MGVQKMKITFYGTCTTNGCPEWLVRAYIARPLAYGCVSARSAVVGRVERCGRVVRTGVHWKYGPGRGGWYVTTDWYAATGRYCSHWYVQNHLQCHRFLFVRHFGGVMKDAPTTYWVIVVCSFRYLGLRARGPHRADAGISFPKTALFWVPIFERPQ